MSWFQARWSASEGAVGGDAVGGREDTAAVGERRARAGGPGGPAVGGGDADPGEDDDEGHPRRVTKRPSGPPRVHRPRRIDAAGSRLSMFGRSERRGTCTGQHRAPARADRQPGAGRVRRQPRAGQRVADAAPGFVWRLEDESGDATSIRVFDDERLMINMSVWRSADALWDFVYSGEHLAVMRRRREWMTKLPARTWSSGGFPPAPFPRPTTQGAGSSSSRRRGRRRTRSRSSGGFRPRRGRGAGVLGRAQRAASMTCDAARNSSRPASVSGPLGRLRPPLM